MKNPKISIITPSFNQGVFLEETILSIINQSYANYELLIIDAGSTDSTVEVIHKYEQHIAYWVSEPDRGQSHAIQKGLEKATGDIINWINSDDLCASGAFRAIAESFNLDEYDVFCGRCNYFVNDISQPDKQNEQMGIFASVGETLLRGHINQPSTFFKASVIKELGINEQFHYTMDVDLWYRYLLSSGQQRVCLSDSLLTYFRLHNASKTVADYGRFEGDRNKVNYNILYSIGKLNILLDYTATKISDFSKFKPTLYKINIPLFEIKEFVQLHSWHALIYYNSIRDFVSARKCLEISLQYGQKINLNVIKQIIKHFIVKSIYN